MSDYDYIISEFQPRSKRKKGSFLIIRQKRLKPM